MKRIRSVLRGREGMTLVELIVSAGLLLSGHRRVQRVPAPGGRDLAPHAGAEQRRADRGRPARDRAQPGRDRHGVHQMLRKRRGHHGSDRQQSAGSAVEFGYETEHRYSASELLTADGCAETAIMVGSRPAGHREQPRVEKGYLLERYYDNSTGVFYSQGCGRQSPVRARASTQTYAEGFYMGLRAGLYFELDEVRATPSPPP